MAKTSTSFQSGQSGNLKGRPKKGYSITEEFRAMFKASPEKKKRLVRAISEKAFDGDMVAAKMIWSYMDGLPQQSVTANLGVDDSVLENPKAVATLVKSFVDMMSNTPDEDED